MDLTRRKKFEIEAIISPLAMASLQTQFVVGDRQQFGFLLGKLQVSSEKYRCDDDIVQNTFYITSIKPVFDVASFQSDVLKSNDKSLSKTFVKHVCDTLTEKREPIVGWYFQGNPDELLKGKDYNLHVKLIRQYFSFCQRYHSTVADNVAFHAFLAAVGSYSYNKKRLSRDFSVGFQGFDERNQLRWYDVKVCVVDHDFRTRHTNDVKLLINLNNEILPYIKEQLKSDPHRDSFLQLQERVFTHPEPEFYEIHEDYITHCFDLLARALKNASTSLVGRRDLELESQIFDYKAFYADPKPFEAAVDVIDKTERNLRMFDILELLTEPTAVVQRGQNSSQPSNPPILVEALEQMREAKAVETKKSSEKMNPEVPPTSENNDQNSENSHGDVSIEASQGPKEGPTESTEGERLDIDVKAAEPVHEGTTKASDNDSPSKAATKVSRSKNRRRRKPNAASSASKEASSITANSTPQTSPEHNLEKQSNETSPFSNSTGAVTTVPSTQPPEVLQGETEDAAKTPSSTSSTPIYPDATDSKLIPSPTTTPIPHEDSSVASPAAQLADSSRKARSKKSKSKKPTGEPEKLPWPNSKDTYIIMPMAKNLSPVHEFWKYHLKPIPESLLTDLKCLRAWRKQAEASNCESSSNDTDDEQLLPDFQEAFGRQSQDESLPPTTEEVAEPPIRVESKLPHEVAFYTDDGVIPLCLLGDKFMRTGKGTEEKYMRLSTISSSDSDDSDSETSTSGHSSEESISS